MWSGQTPFTLNALKIVWVGPCPFVFLYGIPAHCRTAERKELCASGGCPDTRACTVKSKMTPCVLDRRKTACRNNEGQCQDFTTGWIEHLYWELKKSGKAMTLTAGVGFCSDSLLRGYPCRISFRIPFLFMWDFTSVSVDMLLLLPYNFLMELIQDSTVD